MKKDRSDSLTARSGLAGHVMSIVVFAVPVAAVFGGKGLTLLMVVAGVAAVGDLILRGRKNELVPPALVAVIFLAFVLLASFGEAVSPDRHTSPSLLLRMIGLTLLGWSVFVWSRRSFSENSPSFENALLLGVIVSVIMAGTFQISLHLDGQQLWGSNAFDRTASIKPGASVISALVWPVGLILWRRQRHWLLRGFLFFSLIAIIPSNSALVALAAGALAYVAIRCWGMLASAAVGVCSIVLIMSMPTLFARASSPEGIIAALPMLSTSAQHRLYIWEFASRKILEKPLLGWGFDASRAIPGGDAAAPVGASLLPLHPHNAVLQVWLELGLGGALLLCLIVGGVFLLRPPAGDTRPTGALRQGMAATLIVNAMLSYGIWQNWWFSALWLLAAIFEAVGGRSAPNSLRNGAAP